MILVAGDSFVVVVSETIQIAEGLVIVDADVAERSMLADAELLRVHDITLVVGDGLRNDGVDRCSFGVIG